MNPFKIFARYFSWIVLITISYYVEKYFGIHMGITFGIGFVILFIRRRIVENRGW